MINFRSAFFRSFFPQYPTNVSAFVVDVEFHDESNGGTHPSLRYSILVAEPSGTYF